MNKIDEYGDKIYCEKDLSETQYYSAYNPETIYESAEELVEDYFEDCVIGEAGEQE